MCKLQCVSGSVWEKQNCGVKYGKEKDMTVFLINQDSSASDPHEGEDLGGLI